MAAADDEGRLAGRPRLDVAVRLRPCTPADTAFLLELYGSTRAAELALAPWSAEDKAAFVRMQFDAQDRHYRAQFPAAERSVIEVGGEPAGRLYVDRRLDEIRVVDLSLLPAWRGRGIGTALLTDLLDEATGTARPVRLHVEVGNPARRLYVRLGFQPVASSGPYELMEHRP
ncbi:MAG: GNAT family N-acetyltransferase [Frankiaceae bacterium]